MAKVQNNTKITDGKHFGVRQFPQVSHNPHTPSDQSSVSQILFAQSNISYSSVLRNYIRNARFNTSSTPKPSLIVTPLHESHVQSTVVCAKSIPIQIKIRSGGHDFEGISYISDEPFIVLDLFNLRSISVDVQNNVAVVQSGATIGELYYRIWKKSRAYAFPAGVCPTMGVDGGTGSPWITPSTRGSWM
ncbi:berberine bridge enzyme-like 21 [Senna tora]|uniref:Berberine bridge enzyme-like 21 n=1 Tax=Senna tora TaxID=362788 RepID=A0A835CAA2_9FABA|nr:berberine bridge enzyme-like 21 [Senna tora]